MTAVARCARSLRCDHACHTSSHSLHEHIADAARQFRRCRVAGGVACLKRRANVALLAQSRDEFRESHRVAASGPVACRRDAECGSRGGLLWLHCAGAGSGLSCDVAGWRVLDRTAARFELLRVTRDVGLSGLGLVVSDRCLGMDVDRRWAVGGDEPFGVARRVTATVADGLSGRMADDAVDSRAGWLVPRFLGERLLAR